MRKKKPKETSNNKLELTSFPCKIEVGEDVSLDDYDCIVSGIYFIGDNQIRCVEVLGIKQEDDPDGDNQV